MRSTWHRRSITTAAVLALAAGGGLAMAQSTATSPGTSTSPGASTGAYPATPGESTSRSTGTGATATTGETATSGESSSKLGKMDKAFVRKAAQGGLAEVQLGQLAQQQGSSEEVKQFGQRMVTDHQSANEKLQTLAQGMNMELPTTLSKHDQKELTKLQSLHGAAFDKAYARTMRSDHRKDIKEFEREAKHGKDAQLKQFADSTLPTLKDHLALAEKLPSSSRQASAATEAGTTR